MIFGIGIFALHNISIWNADISDKITANILESKKNVIKGHVQRTIDEIEFGRSELLTKLHEQSELLNIKLVNKISETPENDSKELLAELSILCELYPDIYYAITDERSNTIEFCSAKRDDFSIDDISNSIIHVKTPIGKMLTVHTYSTSEILDLLTKDHVANHIRALRIEETGYQWVNEILNYEGGKDYAIRRIHPNSPETEGLFLTTETQDAIGVKPYLTELEGLKNHGEIFFTYYFKELNSENVTQKMTYAKLYKPFNWVIASGVYLDDIDSLKEEGQVQYKSFSFVRGILFFLTIIVIVLIIMCWKIIMSFSDAIIRENKILEDDKRIVETELEAISEIAYQDPLTALYNRRAMLLRLNEELSSSQRHDYTSSIILCDIDYFKAINDTYGHNTGDKVLQEVAHFLRKHLRIEDSIARWGGDEFLILLPHTSVDSAELVADNLRLMLHAHDVSHLLSKGVFAISYGVAEFNENDTCEKLVKKADTAMYESKRSGRDRVSIYRPGI